MQTYISWKQITQHSRMKRPPASAAKPIIIQEFVSPVIDVGFRVYVAFSVIPSNKEYAEI